MIELFFQFDVVVNTIGYIGDDGRRRLIVKHVVDDGLHIDFTGLLLGRSLLLLAQQSHVAVSYTHLTLPTTPYV